MKAGFFEIF